MRPYLVVGVNLAVNMITVISTSTTKENAERSARDAPSRWFKKVTIIPPDAPPYQVAPAA